MDFRKAVDGADAVLDEGELVGGDGVAFVEDDDVGVGDLEVRCRFVMMELILRVISSTDTAIGTDVWSIRMSRLVETPQYIRRVNQAHNPVQVDGASQPLVYPEQRCQVARVCEPTRFEDDVVKGAATVHEGFNGVDTTVFNGAADTAVPELEPFLDFLAVLSDGEGTLNVRC